MGQESIGQLRSPYVRRMHVRLGAHDWKRMAR